MKTQKDLIENNQWDVMIVLDACRYDEFVECIKKSDIIGNYMKVDSQALHTAMWYEKNWKMENDVNLISGHGILWLEEFSIFKRFKNPYGFFNNERKKWIYPGFNFSKLLEYQIKYPGMKTLVHIIPPHLPFLGKMGHEFMKELDVINPHTTEGHGNMNAYNRITQYGRIHGWDRPRKCYMENILFAIIWIEKFIDRMKGQVIITADHGELLGEGGIYGHDNSHGDILRSVPWFEVKK